MATWQRGQTTDAALQVLQSSTTRTLAVPTVLEELHIDHTTPKTSEPVFTIPVNKAWFRKSEEGKEFIKRADAADLAFFLCRQNSETRPSWTAFNQSPSSVDNKVDLANFLSDELYLHAPKGKEIDCSCWRVHGRT